MTCRSPYCEARKGDVVLSRADAGEIAHQLRGYVHRLEMQLRATHDRSDRADMQEIIGAVRANIQLLQILTPERP